MLFMSIYSVFSLLVLYVSVNGFIFPKERSALEIPNLNGLSQFTAEYDEIFTPLFTDTNEKHYKHDVHVVDKFGKYLKLRYEAKHPDNAYILKLDHTSHKINIKSIVCHHDSSQTIELHFKLPLIANEYLEVIKATLKHSEKNYFITAGHEWGCKKPNGRYESILREVTAVSAQDNKVLILQTIEARLVDIFEYLDMDFRTNTGMHQHKEPYTKGNYDAHITHTNRRRLSIWTWIGSFVTEVKNAIVDGIKAVKDAVIKTVERIAKVATILVEYTLGLPINIDEHPSYTWGWNYDEKNNKAEHGFDLFSEKEWDLSSKDSKVSQSLALKSPVTCNNCYAYVKLDLHYKLSIDNHIITYTLMNLTGSAEIHIDLSNDGLSLSYALVIPTPELPVPDYSFEVGKIKFGLFYKGEVEIGVELAVESSFTFALNAKGVISKGFEYIAATHTQNFINEHNFTYDRKGPEITFKKVTLGFYVQPTIYVILEHVGSVYFGFQPKVQLEFKVLLNNESCSLYFTPSIILQPFVGVNVSTLGFNWAKKYNFEPMQTDITSWSGCILKEKLLKVQTTKPLRLAPAEPIQDDGNTQYLQEVDMAFDRRRMLQTQYPSLESNTTNTYVNMDHIGDTDITPPSGFGASGTQWWSNMSTIDELCDDWAKTCISFEEIFTTALSPDSASLLIHVKDENTLIAMYQTRITTNSSNWWMKEYTEVYGTITCIARHQLTKVDHETDDIPTYDVELLEWDCDTNLTSMGISDDIADINDTFLVEAWECMISLPQQLNAMEIHSSFGNIMLFDNTWCQVFSLTKKHEYQLTQTQIDKMSHYPSPLWHGLWSCAENKSTHMDLYFTDFNTFNGPISAVLLVEVDNGTQRFYLSGNVNLAKRKMDLNLLYWYEGEEDYRNDSIIFYGDINILYDGTISYAGSIEMSGCTGFLFQGHLNTTQFEDDDNDDEDEDADKQWEKFCVAKDDYEIIGAIGAVVLLLLCLLCICCILCMKYRKRAKGAAPTSYAMNDVEMNKL